MSKLRSHGKGMNCVENPDSGLTNNQIVINIYNLKILFCFDHGLFLLQDLSGEMNNFSYPFHIGRILNRFSKDTGHMDDSLPLTFLDFIQVMYQSCQSSPRE